MDELWKSLIPHAYDADMNVFFLVYIPFLTFVLSTSGLELGPDNIEVPDRLDSTDQGREDA